jgi:nucleoside transporter
VASLILGIFSFTLPKTPPKGKQEGVTVSGILGLDALKLLKDRNFLVFFVSSVLICIPLAFYYQHAAQFLGEISVENPAGKMTIGQISEVLFMLLLPVFFTRFGFKKTILVGMLAWTIRYFLFSFGDAGSGVYLLLIGIALHGICYDFFFVSGQIYTDSKAGDSVKSAAQGLITLATYGVGMLIGFAIAGQITDAYALADGGHDWKQIWTFPALFAIGVFALFAIFFKKEKVAYKS